MTVANNNLSSSLIGSSTPNPSAKALSVSIGAEAASASSALNQNQYGQKVDAVGGGDRSGEFSFRSIVQQQISATSINPEAQVIDNKDLNLTILNSEVLLEGAEIDNQWMQTLKSHFLNEQSALASEEVSDLPEPVLEMAVETGIEDGTVPLVGDKDSIFTNAIPAAEAVETAPQDVVLIDQGGESLPQTGQVVSAIKTISKDRTELSAQPSISKIALSGTESAIKQEAALPAGVPQKSVMSEEANLNVALAQGEDGSNEDMEFNLDKLLQDKTLSKQASQQSAMSGIRDAAAAIAPTAHQTGPQAVATPVQNLSANQLPAHLQSMGLSPQSTQTQWGEALGERVSFLVNHKLNNAEIRIDPPHLGKLDIQIQVKDDAATITIHTQHAQTRDMIESASARLREFLQEAGYSTVNVDVSHQEQSMQRDMAQQDSQSIKDDQGNQSAFSDEADSSSSEMMSVMMDNGRIDYFA